MKEFTIPTGDVRISLENESQAKCVETHLGALTGIEGYLDGAIRKTLFDKPMDIVVNHFYPPRAILICDFKVIGICHVETLIQSTYEEHPEKFTYRFLAVRAWEVFQKQCEGLPDLKIANCTCGQCGECLEMKQN
jgi:hypothetical protein